MQAKCKIKYVCIINIQVNTQTTKNKVALYSILATLVDEQQKIKVKMATDHSQKLIIGQGG